MDEKLISEIYERNGQMVYRMCFSYLKNREDALDATQNTFLQMIRTGKVFENIEHEKAWLLVTSSNICKNLLKHWWRKNVSIQESDALLAGETGEDRELMLLILDLPLQYRIPIYLYYYEGYSTAEIAKIVGKSDATVRWYLMKGRELIRKELG